MPVDRRSVAMALALGASLLVTAVAAANGEDSAPDLEFLEYLGSLVREGDDWLDPSDLRGPAEAERDRVAAQDDAIELEPRVPGDGPADDGELK